MIYNSEQFKISKLKQGDALLLNKLFVSNTDRFIHYLPYTLEENTTLAGTQHYIAKKLKATDLKEEFVYVIHDHKSRDIIGLIILKNLDWPLKKGEFAYCISKRFKGNGLMTEAIKAVSNYVFKEMDLEIVQIIAHKSNLPSVNVAVSANFKWIKTLLNEFTPINNVPLDMELFELSKPSPSIL